MATAGHVRAAHLPDVPRDPAGRIALDAVVDALGRTRSVLLESSPGTPHAIPWSFVALTSGSVVVDDGSASTWRSAAGTRALGADPFAAVAAVCDRFGLHPEAPVEEGLPPFTGGLVGAFSYDLARRTERLPSAATVDRPRRQLHLEAVATVVAVDHRVEEAWLVQRDLPGVTPVDEVELRRRLRTAPAPRPATPEPPRHAGPMTSSFDRAAYLAAVRTVLARITAGDVFQVNLAQRLTGSWAGDAHDLYRRLRARSPAPHGAVLPAVGVASISPESFLLATGTRVTMRPMKGTRPRHASARADAAARDELASSSKDRAENVMVVDMQRNDLGRVCVAGSVAVPRLCELEPHPTVWQLVSTVEGQLRPQMGWGELLRATFPCGSITGAPKVAAMRLIERLEPVRRGWYCGAIGWLGGGSARLSVAIRTAVVGDGRADYGAGSGIVADSDPDREYQESLVKAGPFLAAIGADLADQRR